MTKLNLTANDKPQELILAYLQENTSDVLAEKINSGTPFEKDGKQLVNKKTLDGFMKYANEEARKLAEKGANSACVEDSVVYGWAIHYFEEDSIEGTLYNADGTEYKPVVKTAPKPATTPVTAKPKETIAQTSLWDMLETKEPKEEPIDESELTEVKTVNEENNEIFDPSIDEIADKLQQAVDEKSEKTVQQDGKVIDVETGVVLSTETDEKPAAVCPFDKDQVLYLCNLLDGKIDIA